MTNTSPISESTDLVAALTDYGIDYANAMERMLNNDALYRKLASHYVNDTNYEALVQDMQVGDFETAYTHVHTLKGVAGNLSFDKLYQLASEICNALTSGDAEGAQGLLDELGEAHARVREGLEYWQGIAG